MHINFHGRPTDEPVIRAGCIGCGSHSFRNIYAAFQFAHVDLVATSDLDIDRAKAFAMQFGAANAYSDYNEMLAKEDLDAVFVITGYNSDGRPLYPQIACDVLAAGCHVWIEKPPAATCADIEQMQKASAAAGREVMCGFKKMFFPANVKAKELIALSEFGTPQLATLQYPQFIPEEAKLTKYLSEGVSVDGVPGFLDHLCHPVSLMVYLFGMPATLYYQRSNNGAGSALFTYPQGLVVTLLLTDGQASEGGMERTFILGTGGHHLVVENNHRVEFHRNPSRPEGEGYGNSPSHFTGSPDETTAIWEPEFSLGQLYNKGLFLLGYYGEIEEFANSILQERSPENGTLDQAWQVTRVFEAFCEGPGKEIIL